MKEITFEVEGMMCEGCENRVKNALSTIEGITNVEANHKTGKVVVTTNREVEISVIKEKIIDLGFQML